METIELRIKKIVSKQLGVPIENISNTSSFIEDLGGDSLDTVEMVLELEDRLNIEIPEEVAEEMIDIQAVLNYIKSINL
jgi:acyl carrier protein